MKKYILMGGVLLFAFALSASLTMAATQNWNVVGSYTWLVLGTYSHDIVISTQNPDGTFTGTGGYPSGQSPYTSSGQTPETISGKVTGNDITFTTTYSGPYNPGYTVTVSGTIASDGSISGNVPWEWHLTSGKAKPVCTETGFYRDGINMTAALINPGDISGDVNGTGCNTGVYYNQGGSVDNANIFGANYFGIVVDGSNNDTKVDIQKSNIHNIGENPFNGTQHGIGVYYTGATDSGSNGRTCSNSSYKVTGTFNSNTISKYQKNAIVINCPGSNVDISNNTVTGEGSIPYIAQNGIQISRGATGIVSGNNVSGNEYGSTVQGNSGGPDPINNVQSVGILLYQAGDKVSISSNTLNGNDVAIYNLLKDSGKTSISNNALTDNRYAGIELDQGDADVTGNSISGSAIGIAALSFTGNSSNTQATITANKVNGSTDAGIKLLNDGNDMIPLIIAHGNDLSGNSVAGVENKLTNSTFDATDATDNWWGNANGPFDDVSGDGSTPDENLGGTGSPAIGAVNYADWCVNENCTTPLPSVATDLATDVESLDAILNGTNGPLAATGHSFWVSLASIDTSSPNIPSGVYSTPDMGSIAANTPFQATLSSLTSNGVPGNLPTIMPNTKYYFVAWSNIGGTWYHGIEQSFTTKDGPIPATPGVTTNSATNITSSDATLNAENGPVNATGHSFWVSLASIDTSSPNIPSGVYSTPDMGSIAANTPFQATLSSLTSNGVPGNLPTIMPNTKYYFVAWSLVGGKWYPGKVIDFTTASIVPKTKDQCMNNGWRNLRDADFIGMKFKNQGDCVSFVATGGKNKAAGQ